MDTYLIPDCGICSQPHRCHSPHLQAWCLVCCPDPTVAAANLAASAVAALARPARSDYARREGLELPAVRVQLLRYA